VPRLVLFTRDLRVHDHPALTAAASADGGAVVPSFVLDPALRGRSPNRDRFLLECLAELDRSLARVGSRLVTRTGDPVEETVRLARQTRCDAVHVTADVSAYAVLREARLREALARQGTALHMHGGHAVVEPGAVRPAGRAVYSIFTPYHRSWAAAPRRGVLDAPTRLVLPPGVDVGERPSPDSVRPESIDLAPGGEAAGRRHLETFLAVDASEYGAHRDEMALDKTSRLSPYLRFGCLSANEVTARAAAVEGAAELVRQIAWRDFYGQLLAHDPTAAWRDMHAGPRDVAPVSDVGTALERWKAGRTGLPLVDAGMRQLRREGWMHNRARMIVGSFLTRRLGIAWQEGARHFARWLLDGDPANNAGGWQWVAGTGTDARSSRSFNPVRQARRFDPDGVFVRRYVRELAGTPTSHIFSPWSDPKVLGATGYPAPILDVPAG
jgi:deoxyribodipyrimidine photo-lyase